MTGRCLLHFCIWPRAPSTHRQQYTIIFGGCTMSNVNEQITVTFLRDAAQEKEEEVFELEERLREAKRKLALLNATLKILLSSLHAGNITTNGQGRLIHIENWQNQLGLRYVQCA